MATHGHLLTCSHDILGILAIRVAERQGEPMGAETGPMPKALQYQSNVAEAGSALLRCSGRRALPPFHADIRMRVEPFDTKQGPE